MACLQCFREDYTLNPTSRFKGKQRNSASGSRYPTEIALLVKASAHCTPGIGSRYAGDRWTAKPQTTAQVLSLCRTNRSNWQCYPIAVYHMYATPNS